MSTGGHSVEGLRKLPPVVSDDASLKGRGHACCELTEHLAEQGAQRYADLLRRLGE